MNWWYSARQATPATDQAEMGWAVGRMSRVVLLLCEFTRYPGDTVACNIERQDVKSVLVV